MKKLLPKRKPERKPSEEDFTVRKSKYAVYMRRLVEWHRRWFDQFVSYLCAAWWFLEMGAGIPELESEPGSWILFLVVAKCFFIVFVNKRNTGVAFISSQIPCTLTQAVGWYSSYSWNHAVHLSRACQRTHSWKFSTISWDLSSLSLRYSSSGGGRSDSESDWGLLYQCQDTTNSQLQWVCFSISTYMLTHC